MNKTFIAIIIGIVSLIVSWLLLNFAIWELMGFIGGIDLQERLIPYVNVHFLEEASENIYSPLKDWLFVANAVAVNFISFGFSSFIATYICSNGQRFVAITIFSIGLVATLFIHFFVFRIIYPPSFQTAYMFEIVIAASSTVLGFYLGTRWKRLTTITDRPRYTS